MRDGVFSLFKQMEGGYMQRMRIRGVARSNPDTFETKAQDNEKGWGRSRQSHTPGLRQHGGESKRVHRTIDHTSTDSPVAGVYRRIPMPRVWGDQKERDVHEEAL